MKSPRDQDIVSLWGWGQGHLFHHETTRLSRGGGGAWKISLILKLWVGEKSFVFSLQIICFHRFFSLKDCLN